MTVPARWRPGPAQQDLWVYEQIAAPSLAYTVVRTADVTGPLDPSGLERAVRRLADRHPVLRCAAELDDDEQLWLADTGTAPALERPAGPGDRGSTEARTAVEACALTGSVSLEDRPAWRAYLFEWAPGEATVLLLFHHALVDGWSGDAALADLVALYVEETGGDPAPDPPAADYRKFAAAQAAAAERPDPDDLGYWRERLAGAPAARPWQGPAGSGHRRSTVPVVLPADATGPLQRAAGRLRVTEFAVCLAAVGAAVAHWLPAPEVTLAAGVSRQPGSRRVPLGLYVDVLLLRLPVEGRHAPDLVAPAFDVLVDALDHGSVPHQVVVREAVGGTRGDVSGLAQVSVTMHGIDDAPRQAGGLTWQPRVPMSAYSVYPLHIALQRGSTALHPVVAYDPDRYDRPAAEALAAGLRAELLAVLAGAPAQEGTP